MKEIFIKFSFNFVVSVIISIFGSYIFWNMGILPVVLILLIIPIIISIYLNNPIRTKDTSLIKDTLISSVIIIGVFIFIGSFYATHKFFLQRSTIVVAFYLISEGVLGLTINNILKR